MKFNIIYQNRNNTEKPINKYYIIDSSFRGPHPTHGYGWICNKNYSLRYKFNLKKARYIIENYNTFADKQPDGKTFCFDFKIIPDGIKYYEQYRL